MAWLKAHWPTAVSAIGFAMPFMLPSLNAYIAAHEHTEIGVLLSCVVAAWYSNQKQSGGK